MLSSDEMKTGCFIGCAYAFIYTIIYGIPAAILITAFVGLVKLLQLLQ